jgi:tetratricopeptide (TPR) repeat protein
LVDLAEARGDQASRVFYLERLAFMYDQLQRPSDAIRIKQSLVAYYQAIADIPETTALYIALGNDFTATDEVASAEQSYVSAYALAWEAKQFYRAGEAIDRLAELYDREARYDDALKTYRIAIDIDAISNDRYGLMVTYDTIGQLYQRLNAYAQALDAYQRGLEVAQQISSRTSYFQFQIDTVSRLLRR